MSQEFHPLVLLIGGLDSTSGAGVTLDNRVAEKLGVHGLNVVTAVTAQNSKGVWNCETVSNELFTDQLKCLAEEFVPEAIKVGLVTDSSQFSEISKTQEQLSCPLVWDPVISSSSGGLLSNSDLVKRGLGILNGQISLLTPNISEAQAITNIKISNIDDMASAASEILKMGVNNVLIKGGHLDSENKLDSNESIDYFCNREEAFWVSSKRIKADARESIKYDMKEGVSDAVDVRGTGCALSSGIASLLAKSYDLRDAIVLAKGMVAENLRNNYQIGNMRFQGLSGMPSKFQQLPTIRYLKPESKGLCFARCDTHSLGIYPVVDSADWLERLLDQGIKTIQLRVKDKCQFELEDEISQSVKLAQSKNARLFINDYWQLAIKHNAYGVHLGQEDLLDANLEEIAQAGLRLGVSTHSHWEVAAAIDINPSYIALGPIYETTSKEMPFSPQGIEMVNYWIEFLDDNWPLVAIGGINHERAKHLKKTGVGSIAMISSITQAEDYIKSTSQFMDIWRG